MKVAVVGCSHGELDIIYKCVETLQKRESITIDLLIVCGDFQSVRHDGDLKCMAVPLKYQRLNTFYKYYFGEKRAPVLTIFVGGNHEASNYLSELVYNGWVCENIFYMGHASVINIGGLRIAGLSGIYKGSDYLYGHFELAPYDESSKRTIYHVRNLDVFRLKQLQKPVDIFISHDWPRGIHEYGNKKALLRKKPFFKADIADGKLGSRPSEELLFKLKPRYWFAAHLHCEFAALVPHGNGSYTKFLALDKCLPHRKFLKVIDINTVNNQIPSCLEIKYDPEWLGILRSTNHLLSVSKVQNYMPGQGCSDRWDFSVTNEELASVHELFGNDFTIPRNFVHPSPQEKFNSKSESCVNPQTTHFCKKLSIQDPLQLLLSKSEKNKPKRFSFIDEVDVTNVSEMSFDPDQSDTFQENKSSDDFELDSSDLFIIDKSPRSFSSSSPSGYTKHIVSPNFHSPIEVPQKDNLSHSSSPKANITFEFPAFKENDNIAESAPGTSGVENLIKIKRRNLSVYSSEQSDEN